MAAIELVMAVAVLGMGAGGWLQAGLLVGWVALALGLGWRYCGYRHRWTEARLGMTDDLVERMVGYRTRLAQEAREHWHDGEDQALARYLKRSGVMDRAAVRLLALVPRGWVVVGLLGLAPQLCFRPRLASTARAGPRWDPARLSGPAQAGHGPLVSGGRGDRVDAGRTPVSCGHPTGSSWIADLRPRARP